MTFSEEDKIKFNEIFLMYKAGLISEKRFKFCIENWEGFFNYIKTICCKY